MSNETSNPTLELFKEAIRKELEKAFSLTPLEGVIKDGQLIIGTREADLYIAKVKAFYEEILAQQTGREIEANCKGQTEDGKLTFEITVKPRPLPLEAMNIIDQVLLQAHNEVQNYDIKPIKPDTE